jgi:hypothetical protein
MDRKSMSKAIEASPGVVYPVDDDIDRVVDVEADDEVIEDPITAWDLYTKPRLFGMPATYLTVGVIYGGQGAIIYPVFQVLLETSQNYYNAVGSTVALFWSFKIFYGFLSDSVTYKGLRRKPYIVFGWFFSAITTALQAIYVTANEDTTYCFNDEGKQIKVFPKSEGDNGSSQCPPDTYYEANAFNREKFSGTLLVVFMFFTNFAYMFADVAADGLAVEYAKREIPSERGRIQSYNYVCRFSSTIIMTLLTGFGLNTPLYGGDFAVGISLSAYLWILTVAQGIFLPFYFIMEEKAVDPKLVTSVGYKMKGVWQLLMNKAFAALMVFQVMYNLFTSIGPVGGGGLAAFWVKANPIQNSVATVFIYIAITITIWVNGKYLTNYSWRCLQSFGLITSTVMGLLTLLIVFNVTRDPWFWVFTQVDSTVLSFIGWLTAIWATNEMAPPGLEGTALAIATTSSNASGALSTYFRNLIGGQFQLRGKARYTDPAVQDVTERDWAINLLVTMAINLCGLVFMWLLPNQREQARRRYQTWGSGVQFGFVGLGIICFAMFYGSITNIATLLCSCDEKWGGDGCIPGTCDDKLPTPKVTPNGTNNVTNSTNATFW